MKSLSVLSLILSFVVFFVSLNLLSQTIVPTTPENRNALIEEFTGIACGFCPYGHLEVANFIAAHPDDGFSIAYHQGFFALPDPGQPDYTTVYGDGLGSYFNVNSWPNGLINRHDFGGGPLYTLDVWQQHASQVITETAYVNVACESTVDVQTRELIIYVETYYTDNGPEPSNFLNVAITQNNVKGVQFSSWFNPDAITPDGEYLHQHMFRDFATGQWGDEISPTSSGSFIISNYVTTLPMEINDIPLRLGDLSVLSYITETEMEVETAFGAAIVLTNFAYALDAGIDVLEIPETSCSYLNSVIEVANYGSLNITSLTFEISINGDDPVEYAIDTDPIRPFTAEEIEIPAVYYADMGTNEYSITITEVNGFPDENNGNDNATASFDEAIEVVLPLTLHLETDGYFGTAWYLYDDQNNVVQQGSGYTYNSTFDILLDVDAGCYKFVMTDLDGYFFGSYSISDGNNMTLVETTTGFGNRETTAFTLPIYEPTAIIDASTTVVCIGGTVQFLDGSNGGPSEWNWAFEGGNPPTSIEKNPVVSYPQPGAYDVSLEVTNSLGTDNILMEEFIDVTSLAFGNLALQFDGGDDFVEVSNESAFDFTSDMTLEAWIKPEDLFGTQGILSKNYGNNAHPYQIRLVEDEIILGFYSNTIGWQPIQTTNANLQVGEWTHIACTYNMSQAKIYVNGVQKASVNKNFEIPQNDQPFEIGRTKDVGYEYFAGTIDEVRVWDVALNSEEIALNMCTNFLGSTDPHLIANFKFNECGGTLLTDNKNGNHGVLQSMTGDEWVESDACSSYDIKFIVVEDPGSMPLEDVTIDMSGTIRYTNSSGEADFNGYEPNEYEYVVSKVGYDFEIGSFELIDENEIIEISLLINSIDDISIKGIRISPNPTKGDVNVFSENSSLLRIYNLSGNVLKSIEINAGITKVDLSEYPAGLYYFQISEGNNVNYYKIVVQ